MYRINEFFSSLKNIGLAILVWGLILFAGLELGGCVYVNFFQHDPNAPITEPSVDNAQYKVFVKANRRTLFSDDVNQIGSIVNLTGYYVLDGSKYKYVKLPLALDEKYFGDIEVTKR